MYYDYRCQTCKKIKEVEHSMKESPEIKCDCGGEMKRMLQGGSGTLDGIILKGTGWTTNKAKAWGE